MLKYKAKSDFIPILQLENAPLTPNCRHDNETRVSFSIQFRIIC